MCRSQPWNFTDISSLLPYNHKWRLKNLEIPASRKHDQLVTMFLNGDRWNCRNYRRISFFSSPRKVFACILLKRPSTLMEDLLPEAQCGLHANRTTTDMVIYLRHKQKKCIEENLLCYMFFDFAKAFYTLNRGAL